MHLPGGQADDGEQDPTERARWLTYGHRSHPHSVAPVCSYRSHPHTGGQVIYVRLVTKAMRHLGHRVEVVSG